MRLKSWLRCAANDAVPPTLILSFRLGNRRPLLFSHGIKSDGSTYARDQCDVGTVVPLTVVRRQRNFTPLSSQSRVRHPWRLCTVFSAFSNTVQARYGHFVCTRNTLKIKLPLNTTSICVNSKCESCLRIRLPLHEYWLATWPSSIQPQ